MGGSFGALGGKRAGQLFTITDNPIAGLMAARSCEGAQGRVDGTVGFVFLRDLDIRLS